MICLTLYNLINPFNLSLTPIAGELYIRESPRHQRVDVGATVTLNCEPGLDTSMTSGVKVVWHKHGLATQKYR